MARAHGARAQMALAFETVYGTPPASGYRLMPFARATLGAEQPLLNSELLGYGRDPLAPIKDAVTADGEVVVPIDVEAFGFWLKAAFGAPTTTGTTPKTHTFQSGNWTLPSMAIEVAMPELPRFAMYAGCVLDQLSWQMNRSGLLTATARLIAQGENVAATTAAGTPTALGLQRFAHDGREVEFRLVSAADAEARGIEAVRQDRAAYDLPPGDPRPTSLASPVVFGTPEVVMLDLPQISEDQPAHRPLIAAHASPWPGEIAVFRSASTDGFAVLTTFGSRARIGTLAFDFFPGPTSRFDLGNALVVDLLSGTLESVTDVALFGGANALAVETAAGVWEIVQSGAAELIAPGRYRLTRLLRGQRGTEHAMGNPAPAGARVVVLDATLASLPIAEADLGLPWNWRVGPAARAVSDASYAALGFTPTGRGLVPFAPVHVEQPWRIARSPGDLTIRWTRRSRALVADAWEQVEVPLAEDLESYEVQILDGATVKRTLTSTTTSALYTAAQQSADWGAPLGPGQALAIRIFQLSNRLGRGTPASVTLQF